MRGVDRLTITDFTPRDLDDACRLLAARHARHVEAEPLLDPRFAELDAAREALSPYCAETCAAGSVARRGDAVVGYLVGAPKSVDPWGPNMWVDPPSMALAADEPAETARELYAHAAAGWVESGATAHYVVVPSHDEALVDAFFRLGFGMQQVYAAREPAPGAPSIPDDLRLRPARREDIPVLARLDLALPEHQGKSPVFSAGGTPSLDEALQEWEDDFDDPTFRTVVVEHAGGVVGAAVTCALEKSSMHTGIALLDNAGYLGFAAVLPDARGLGAGRALGEDAIAWAAEAGHRSIATDFRATNVHSSRAWTALGFRPTFLRLHRLIGY